MTNTTVLKNDKVVTILYSGRVQMIYKAWLDEHMENSKNTAHSYDKRLREFFDVMFDKSIEKTTEDEITSLERADIQNKYVSYLRQKGNTNNSIAVKLGSVKSYFDYLESNGIDVNPSMLKFKLKSDVSHVDYLSHSEMISLFNYLEQFPETDVYKDEYIMATQFMWVTGFRVGATKNIKWSDFELKKEGNKKIWTVLAHEKKQKDVLRALSDDFMDKMHDYHEKQKERIGDVELTFPRINSQAGYRQYLRRLKSFGEKIDKNITPHSIKASAVTYNWNRTKDIIAVKNFANHSHASTTTDIYIRPDDNLSSQLSYTVDKELNFDTIKKLGVDGLIDMLKQSENRDLAENLLARLEELDD